MLVLLHGLEPSPGLISTGQGLQGGHQNSASDDTDVWRESSGNEKTNLTIFPNNLNSRFIPTAYSAALQLGCLVGKSVDLLCHVCDGNSPSAFSSTLILMRKMVTIIFVPFHVNFHGINWTQGIINTNV